MKNNNKIRVPRRALWNGICALDQAHGVLDDPFTTVHVDFQLTIELTRAEKTRLLIASTMGSWVEFYDFFVFGFCSVLVFNKIFYAGLTPPQALLVSLGTYAVGFLARPVGGIFFGVLGDRFGRKRTLVISLLLMGSATTAMGLLPTYAQIGVTAPILLILLRILQGIAVGGEATGVIVIVAESMPARHRGFWTSVPFTGGPTANVLALGAISLVRSRFGDAAFLQGTWRIPFLASIILIGLGLWARRRMNESTAFVELTAQAGIDRTPLRDAMRDHKLSMAQVFAVKAAENMMLYLFSLFFIVLATTKLGFGERTASALSVSAFAIEIPIVLFAGYLSDKVGRRTVIMAGLIGGLAACFVLFTRSIGVSVTTVQLILIAALACHAFVSAGMVAFFAELFPTRVRFTALSVGYQLASVLGGSLAPLIATFLLQRTGTPFAVALYSAAVIVPAIVCVALSRETRHVDLTAADAGATVKAPISTGTRGQAPHPVQTRG